MTGWLEVPRTNRYNQMYIKGFLDISGGNLILRNNNLYVQGGDASMSGNLYVAKTAYLQNMVCLGDISINGNITGAFKQNSIDPAAIIGGVPVADGIFRQDVSMNYGLYVAGNSRVNNNFTVFGKSILHKDVSLNGNLYAQTLHENGISLSNKYAALSGAIFTGTNTMQTVNMQSLRVTDDISANGNISAGGAIYEGGITLSSKYATLTSPTLAGAPTAPTPEFASSSTRIATTSFIKSQLVGYVTLQAPSFLTSITTPKLFTTSDASLNAKLFVSGDSSMNGLLRIGKTLAVNGNVSLNSRLIVGDDVSLNSRLFVSGDAALYNNLDISGSVVARNNVSIYGIINQYTTNSSTIGTTNTTVGQNTFMGVNSGSSITSGINNTLMGYGAGSNLTTGTNNIVIGANATASTPTTSNEITLGNSSITTLRCQSMTITSLSDQRDKTDIEPLTVGVDFIQKLNPVKFNWNMRDGSRINSNDFGFIAQELQQVQVDSGITIPNLVYDINPNQLEASYAVLIPIMVKSIQELKALVTKQQIEIEALKQNSNLVVKFQ